MVALNSTTPNLSNFFQDNGISFRISCPHTPQQNGLAERKHRHVIETVRTLLIQSALPHKYWVDAAFTAIFLINRLPTSILDGLSPFEKLYGFAPDYSMLRVFGCLCLPNLTPYTKHKLEPHSTQCIFLGYAPNYKGYRCLDPSSCRVYISRHVQFVEHIFPYQRLAGQGGLMSSRSARPLSFSIIPPLVQQLRPVTAQPTAQPALRTQPTQPVTLSTPHGPLQQVASQAQSAASQASSPAPSPAHKQPSPSTSTT